MRSPQWTSSINSSLSKERNTWKNEINETCQRSVHVPFSVGRPWAVFPPTRNWVGIDPTPPTPLARPSVTPPRPRTSPAGVRAGELGLLRGVDTGSGGRVLRRVRHAACATARVAGLRDGLLPPAGGRGRRGSGAGEPDRSGRWDGGAGIPDCAEGRGAGTGHSGGAQGARARRHRVRTHQAAREGHAEQSGLAQGACTQRIRRRRFAHAQRQASHVLHLRAPVTQALAA